MRNLKQILQLHACGMRSQLRADARAGPHVHWQVDAAAFILTKVTLFSLLDNASLGLLPPGRRRTSRRPRPQRPLSSRSLPSLLSFFSLFSSSLLSLSFFSPFFIFSFWTNPRRHAFYSVKHMVFTHSSLSKKTFLWSLPPGLPSYSIVP